MLRSVLTLLGAAVVTFAIVGWFLGWYQVRTTPGADGHRQVEIDFNAPKITQDLSKGTAKIKSMLEPHSTQSAPTTVTAPTLPPLPLPPGSQPSAAPGNSSGIQPASGTVIVRPSTPIPSSLPLPPSAPAPSGSNWDFVPQN
jgi:hypothetical protein